MTSPSQPSQMSVARNSPTRPSFGKAGTHCAGEEDLSQGGRQANHASETAGDASLVAQSRSTTPVRASFLLASRCARSLLAALPGLGSCCHADLHLRRHHSNASWGIQTRWACALLPPRTHELQLSRHGGTPTEVAFSGMGVPRRHHLAPNCPEEGPEEPPGVLSRYFYHSAAWLETQIL